MTRTQTPNPLSAKGVPLRRNDIVVDADRDGWSPYGRVNRVIDDLTVEVAWGKDGIDLEPAATLDVHNHYRGYVDRGPCVIDPATDEYAYPKAVFRTMPSLRKLKQAAISWGRGAWARDREAYAADLAKREARWAAEDAEDDPIE